MQKHIRVTYGITVKTCWITDMKESYRLIRKYSINRNVVNKREYLFPIDKKDSIIETLKYYDMI